MWRAPASQSILHMLIWPEASNAQNNTAAVSVDGIALRQHVPLRACVEYPQHRFQHMAGRDRFASRTSIGNVLFRKMIPDTLPIPVRE